MPTHIHIQPARVTITTTGTDGSQQVKTYDLALTADKANNQLHEYNLPEATSLHPATALKELFPGLQLRQRTEVETRHPAEFIKQYRPEPQAGDELVIASPGEESSLLQALGEADLLKTFTSLSVLAHEEPRYENARSADETLGWLQQQGFELKNTSAEDPDWPVWELMRNPLQDKVDEQAQTIRTLKKQLEDLKNQLNESNKATADARQEVASLTGQRKALEDELKQVKGWLTERKEQLALTEKALQEKEQELEATNKSLQDHKTWFRSRKEQAVALEEETSKQKQRIEQLQTENQKLTESLKALESEKHQLLKAQEGAGQSLALLEQKMEQLFKQQATQLTQTANALGQHVTRSFVDQRQQIQSITGLNQYLETGETPLEYGGWAIEADLAGHLVRAIEQTPYDLVIEFGSGTSTVLMAKAIANTLREKGQQANNKAIGSDSHDSQRLVPHSYDLPRRVLSFEQDSKHKEKTETTLRQNGLDHLVELVLAPLVTTHLTVQSGPSPTLFYNCEQKLANIAGLFQDRQARILVLVDGPFSPDGNPLAREPALANVLQHLSAHRLDIVLDDTSRQGEQQVLEHWQQLCEQRGLTFKRTNLATIKGAAWLSISS